MTARDHLIGQILRPGQKPESVEIVAYSRKGDFESVTVTTTAYTVFGKKYILVDDDTAGAQVTITLPPAIDNTDEVIVVKKLGTTANVVVDGNASETIDGVTTNTLTTQYASVMIVCDGANWHII
jgi:hypothetical protein